MTDPARPAAFRERLWPTPWLYVALLLILPAVALVMTPINQVAAIPVAVLVFAIVAGVITAISPTITVENGTLTAGRASIEVRLLGEIEVLSDQRLRSLIGAASDARNYLLVSGWVHGGVRVAVEDPADPTPNWIITTRRPRRLAEAIAEAKLAA